MEVRLVRSYCALGVGIAAISFGAIFIRLADAPAPVVSALRMVFASIILLPFCAGSPAVRTELRGMPWRDLRFLALAGALLALHFILWVSSLSFTTIASSVLFVTMNPLWVALFAVFVFRERVPRRVWVGLALAILGGAVLGGGDLHGGEEQWKGDLLAVGGGIAAAGYFLVGSRLRRRLSIAAYVCPVYGTAAVFLSIAASASGSSFAGIGLRSCLYCFLMALVCQVIGHSLFNWALRHLEATIVALGVVGEPVGASILAFIIFREDPGIGAVAGGTCILLGIFIALAGGGGKMLRGTDYVSGG